MSANDERQLTVMEAHTYTECTDRANCWAAGYHDAAELAETKAQLEALRTWQAKHLVAISQDPTFIAACEQAETVPLVAELVGRIQWARQQIDAALEDTRIDPAAAAWLRTMKEGLVNQTGDVPQYPVCAHGEGSSHCIEWPSHIFCPGPITAVAANFGGSR